MTTLVSHLVLVLVVGVWLLLPKNLWASAQLTCDDVRPYSLGVYYRFADRKGACTDARSQCSVDPQCDGVDGVDGDDCDIKQEYEIQTVTSTCLDSCSYSLNGYDVERVTVGRVQQTSVNGEPIYSTTNVGLVHTFNAGAEGHLTYLYEPSTNFEPNQFGNCIAVFNGNNCICEPRYCDDSRATYTNFIDCRAFEGGALITCDRPEITSDSPVMEALYWIPFLCSADASGSGGPTPVPGSTLSPALEPTATTGPPAPEPPGPATPSPPAPQPSNNAAPAAAPQPGPAPSSGVISTTSSGKAVPRPAVGGIGSIISMLCAILFGFA